MSYRKLVVVLSGIVVNIKHWKIKYVGISNNFNKLKGNWINHRNKERL